MRIDPFSSETLAAARRLVLANLLAVPLMFVLVSVFSGLKAGIFFLPVWGLGDWLVRVAAGGMALPGEERASGPGRVLPDILAERTGKKQEPPVPLRRVLAVVVEVVGRLGWPWLLAASFVRFYSPDFYTP